MESIQNNSSMGLTGVIKALNSKSLLRKEKHLKMSRDLNIALRTTRDIYVHQISDAD